MLHISTTDTIKQIYFKSIMKHGIMLWCNSSNPPWGLLSYHREVCIPQQPGQLCWQEHKLLVGPPMPDRSKSRDQTKCSPWSSRLGLVMGLTIPTRKNLLLWNHGGGQDPHRVVVPVKNMRNSNSKMILILQKKIVRIMADVKLRNSCTSLLMR
jgi:hypothetical protein